MDNAFVYPTGINAGTIIPGKPNVGINVIGPDFDGGNQKTAIGFNDLNSGLPGSITSVTLKVFVPYIYINIGTHPNNDIRVSLNGSDNIAWPEGLSNNIANFPANNNDPLLTAAVKNILVADVNETMHLDTSGDCAPINNVLLGCLKFDVTNYVMNQITTLGKSEVTFLMTGRQDAGKTSYFSIYPDENAAYKPQLIFAGSMNSAPTNMSLSPGQVAENQAPGTSAGTLSTTDADAGETFSYQLVSGTGDTDNAQFTISSNDLRTASSFNYESKSSYSIRVRVTDSASNTYDKQFTVSVTNVNEAPTDIALSSGSVSENAVIGTTVGTLSSTDPDTGDTFTYTLVAGAGSTDNASFSISGNELKTGIALDYETKTSYSVRVRAADSGGLAFEKVFAITVTDGNDAPTNISLSASSVAENMVSGTAVGTLTAADPNVGNTFTYSLVAGAGDTDNASFQISSGTLQTNTVFDYETKNSYSIRVRATDNGGLSFEKQFTITILNGNDTPTDITLSNSTVNENVVGGTAVGTLTSADIDAGETFTYSLVSGIGSTDNASFQIDGNTLKTDTNAALNFESKSSYSIRVRVTDSANNTFEKPFTITVVNVNETPTDIALSNTSLSEDTASGTTVGALSATDQDAGETFAYSLVAGTGDTDNASFTISGSDLVTSTTLDFETKSSYSIRVRVTDSANNTFDKEFTISVTNVNETPTDIDLSNDSVLENVSIGTTVGALSATDDDVSDTFTYTLVAGAGSTDNASFSITGNELKTGTAIDYETKNSYSIRVRATDNGGLSVEKQFTITVLNGNDAPTDITLSNSTVNEDVAGGTAVGTLASADIDAGETFTYSLVSGIGSTDNASFQIDGNTLKTDTNAALNFESKSSYSIRVRVTDSANNTFEKPFTITVVDVNEKPTDIALSNTSLSEDTASGTTVGALSATDQDAGETFAYSLVAGTGDTDNASFTISGSDLVTSTTLDFETQPSYSIRVRVTDSASNTFDKEFTISVTNVNEAPTDIDLSNDSVSENAPIGTTVGTWSATDEDAGDTFTYSLVAGAGSTDNASFSITGNELKTGIALDYETKTSYSIRVRVTDDDGLSFEKVFAIAVIDGNDVPTDILLSASSVAENMVSGTTVGTLSTVDSNTGDTFTYSLVTGAGDTNNASFQISGGTLQTNAIFDYESTNSYSIRVRATDNGGLIVEKQFTITILDGNDAPTDITLSNSTVNENVASSTAVGTFTSADIDAGETFTYSLVSGAGSTDNASFQIDGNTLETNAALNYESKSSYSIRVRVTDSANNTFEKPFTITVVNVNETPTDIALSNASLSEDTASGTTVGALSATDQDAGEIFTYSLVAGTGDTDNASFTISGSNLVTGTTLDFETKSSYSIRVRVTDSANNTFDKEFTISVTNVNEAPTDIDLSNDSVSENAPIGTTVGTWSATDEDAGDTFTYTLVAGAGSTDNASFSITSNELKTGIALDYETKNSYSIRVRVADGDGLSFEKVFAITVVDGNDAPTDISISSASIAENEASGTTVGAFSTVDSNGSDTFTYTLVSGAGDTDNASFTIAGGNLLTNETFDYESKNAYSIRIRVTDSGTPAFSFEKEFAITVTDGNDAPTDISLTNASVAENLPAGTAVGTISAADIDAGETFTYSLVSGIGSADNASFSISGDTLQTNDAFNFETKASYSIRIQVEDSANHTYQKVLVITVDDVNEAPTGSVVINDSAVNTASSEVVLDVTAADPDGDSLEMRFSNDGTVWSAWEAYAAQKAWTLAAPDGSKTVYMQLRDDAHLSSATYEDDIMLDETAPTGTLIINDGDANTKHKKVNLAVTSGDGTGVGGIQARFSNDGVTWSSWENAPLTKEWTLTNGKGVKTVYMQLKDAMGNISPAITDTIIYKSLPKLANINKSGQDNQRIQLSLADFGYSSEDGSELQKIKLVSLPEHGMLKLNDVAVKVGQEIDLADINKLVYVPQSGWGGTIKLEWNGNDGELYSDEAASLSIVLKVVSGGVYVPVTPTEGSIIITINGNVQEGLGTTQTTKGSDGKKISTITIDEKQLNDILDKEGNISIITTSSMQEGERVVSVLNGQMVKSMGDKQARLQMHTNIASYSLPTALIDLSALSSQLDNAKLADIEVKVEMTRLSQEDTSAAFQKLGSGNVAIVAPAVAFKVFASYNGKTVEINQFDAYVERTIAIPDGVDFRKITTGVTTKPDGTLVHVPTKVIQKDGKYYAVINSLTNNVYSVIYNEKSFADLEKHWSKEVVNEMGARLVINGVDDKRFAPDLAITRAEFAAVIVRALGLRDANKSIAFTDVAADDWFYTAVAIGQEYGLIKGYSDSEFGPSKLISRQEAMAIIQRALKLAGTHVELTEDQIAAQLSVYDDKTMFSDWARPSAAISSQLGIVQGSDGTVRPKSNITRAETAAMVKRMLVAADLI
ncbi:cadherin domain-containing protein [Paenibacillus plantiphilus]|uniref:cadherin domain-containing protein n=1 Tax=Paenibacillus plantiphilus TaxID=2905650 RepID=UPI001F3C0748|nr:cadherin domain-containing protein [Paenibacillus plantiphilus]